MASNAANKKKTADSATTATSKKKSTQSGSRKSNTNAAASASKTKAGASKTDTAARRQTKSESISVLNEAPVPDNSNPLLAREAVLWLVLALCVFVFVGYCGLGGYVGNVISDICFGIFGISAWVFPVLLFLASAFWISNKGNRLAGIKFGSCVGLYICICSVAALIEGEYDGVYNLGKLYARCASLKQGGGVIGGTICYFLTPALGAMGTGVLLGVLILIALVLITQKSLIGGVKKQGDRFYRSARETSMRHREERRRKEEWERFEELSVPLPDDTVSHADGSDSFSEPKQTYQRSRVSAFRKKSDVGDLPETDSFDSFQMLDLDTADTRVGTVTEVSSAIGTEYTGKRKRKEKSRQVTSPYEERQLDVSVMFSSQNTPRRHRRHASGVTTNTRITGDLTTRDGEVREILPKAYDPEETAFKDEEYAESSRESFAQKNVTEENEGSYYIDLEKNSQERARENSAFVSKVSESASVQEMSPMDFPLHIEGVEEESKTRGAEALPDIMEAEKGENSANSSPSWFDEEAPEVIRAGSGTQTGRKTQGRRRIQTEADQPASDQDVSEPDEAASSGSTVSGKIRRNPHSSQQEIAEGIASVEAEAAEAAKAVLPEYVFPPLDLLKKGTGHAKKGQEQEIRQTAAKLQQTLNSFGVHVTVTNVSCGPSVTRYELLPEQGVKVSRIVSLADDIKLNLAAADIRIEAPIPGKSAVGIEVPNSENATVPLRDLLESDEFQKHPSKLAFATGKDLGGRVVVSDIAKMPHLLIAGATGSGKSVCINTLIMSILYKAKPDEVKLIMIDPKVVELSVYNGIPHLLIPVVTDPKKAAGALNWAVAEMTDRYAKFADVGVRDLKGYNQKISALDDVDDPEKPKKLPQIVIIVDELADLMMVAPGEVEDSICRLAQLARAAGLHLIIATQRPSVNVITGLIKANMPSRIAFSVSSGVDSRTIIDMYGAEKLLGKGDMLFYPQGYQKPARVQGAFVSDEEVSDVVDFLKNSNSSAVYNTEMDQQIAKVQLASAAARTADDRDDLFVEAGKFIIEKDKASIGMLQRVFKIGFNRAARIMDQLSDAGVVGPEEGTKPRKILMSEEQFENYLEENG